MIQLTRLNSFDKDAIHVNKSGEIITIQRASSMPTDGIFVFEVESTGEKFSIDSDNIRAMDIDAIHLSISNEISTLPQKATLTASDNFIIEDSDDTLKKKKATPSAITMDLISEGVNFVRFTIDERLKLSSIAPDSQPTNSSTVVPILNVTSVNEMSDITSSGLDIENSVSNTHVQGTDTTLGTLLSDIDFNNFTGINIKNPVNNNDIVNKITLDTDLSLKQDKLLFDTDFRQIIFTKPGDNIHFSISEVLTSPIIKDTNLSFNLLFKNSSNTNIEIYKIHLFLPKHYNNGTFFYPKVTIQNLFLQDGFFKALNHIKLDAVDTTLRWWMYLNFIRFDQVFVSDLVDCNIKFNDNPIVIPYNPAGTTLFSITNQINQKCLTTQDSYSTSGCIKVLGSDDGTPKQLSLVAASEQQLNYTLPDIDSNNSVVPQFGCFLRNDPRTSIIKYQNPYGTIFLENQIFGQPQFWRVIFSFVVGRSRMKISLKNPLSGFEASNVTYYTTEDNIDNLSVNLTTYCDNNSMDTSFGGSGIGGYQLFFEALNNDCTILINSITRLNPKF